MIKLPSWWAETWSVGGDRCPPRWWPRVMVPQRLEDGALWLSSPAPSGQHARASRTCQPARPQAFLDRAGVGLYREHRASGATTRPSRTLPAKDTAGGPWPTPTRRSSRWRRRPTRSTRLAQDRPSPHAQRRPSSPTSSSPTAVNRRRSVSPPSGPRRGAAPLLLMAGIRTTQRSTSCAQACAATPATPSDDTTPVPLIVRLESSQPPWGTVTADPAPQTGRPTLSEPPRV